MQSTKDTFYLALRDRLDALNPERKVVVDGVERPAVLVVENEPVNAAPRLPNAYYLEWSAPQIVSGSEAAARPLMKMECRVSYRVSSLMAGSVDRGRALSALDAEFLRLCTPPRTPKFDMTKTPPVSLDTFVFWGVPVFEDVDTGRVAKLTVFFFPEVEQ